MSVSAADVKKLREMTGAGMMDCKEALAENGGDFEKSVEFLRKKGLSKAAKKADRATNEGLVHALVSGGVGAMVEVNCETDFVARNDEFITLVQGFAAQALAASDGAPVSANWLLEQPAAQGGTVGESLQASIGKLGENMRLARAVRYRLSGSGTVYSYIHPGARVGVLIEANCGKGETASRPEFLQAVRDMAMQVAALKARWVRREEADASTLDKEREIFRAQLAESGKPAAVIDKIIEGKLGKFFEEHCLLEQPFIKDQDKKVGEHLAEAGKVLGDNLTIARFSRFELGEGV